MNKNNKGFTLVELLSVIVIMGILLLVAIPGVFGVSNNIKANAYRKKVTDIEAAAKLYGKDFVDDIEERGFIQITVKTLIDNNMYRKESDDCVLGSEDKPCVTDPRDYSSMDNDVITILKKEKRFSAYYIFKEEDVDLFEGKKVDDQFGEYIIQLEHNGATYAPQDTVKVKFGQIPDPIIPPKKIFRVHLNSQDGTSSSNSNQEVKFTFRGYYLTNDRSTMYFDADGKGVKYYNHTTDRVLFAAWDTSSFVLPTPTKQGYIFTGWWDKQSGGNLIGKAGMKYTPSRDNISIYGQWAPIVTEVTLKIQGAYSPATDQKINATYDKAMPVISIPKKQYTITYNYNGSTQANSIFAHEAPFAGYFGQANGKGTKYYNANGTSAHVWNVASQTAMIYANWSTVTTKLPTPNARNGYEFLGWYTAATGGTKVGNAGATYSFTGNKTLYAHWTLINYSVTLNNQNATYAGTTSINANYGFSMKTITIPKKTYSLTLNHNYNGIVATYQVSHTFNGYFTSTGGSGTKYINANGTSARNWDRIANTTLYAYWTNGTYYLPVLSRSGYTFAGWWTQPVGGTRVSYGNSSFTVNTSQILYAQWVSTSSYDYGYNGGIQSFTAPSEGYYKLEVWGAQGTDAIYTYGGRGAYSVGTVKLSSGSTVYIVVGGNGGLANNNSVNGGYNGGGGAGTYAPADYAGGGGGATHIAYSSGVLSNLNGNRGSVLIVAAGGGGAYYYGYFNSNGGDGGGYMGGYSKYGTCSNRALYIEQNNGTLATQSTGGTGNVCENGYDGYKANGGFGYGGTHWHWSSGGGGGWFGGGSGYAHGAGGGSSYIGNSQLVSSHGVTKAMYCFQDAYGSGCRTSNDESIRTYQTICQSGNAMSGCAKIGTGFAKITFLGI